VLDRMFLKFRSSMSAKIALIVTVPIVIIIFFISYHQYTHDRASIFHSAKTRLLYIAEGLKGPAEIFIRNNDYAGLQITANKAALGADIQLIMLCDQHGRVDACNQKQWIGKNIREMHPAVITNSDLNAIQKAITGGYSVFYGDPEGLYYRFVMPLSTGRGDAGAALISQDAKHAQAESKKQTVENVLISITVVVLNGMAIYFLFYYLFTKRVQAMSASAIKLAPRDMTVRAEEKGADELSYLATSFNVLADEITTWRSNLQEIAASRTKEISVLYDIVDTISESLELHKVLPKVLDRVLENLGAEKGAVVLVGSDGRSLDLFGHRGLSEEGAHQISQLGQGCTGDVILRNRPLRVPAEDEEESAIIPGLELENVHSALVVPITARGAVLGALAVYSEKSNAFSDQEEALLMTIGSQAGVAVENAQLYEKTLELAQLDGLTGLANRRYLMERLKHEMDRAERYQTSLSVVMLDLDKFKSFNDTYGHLKGDELLKGFCAMVRNAIRTTDIAGRYGGEEFCVVLPNTSVKGAVVIAERIRKSAEKLRVPIDDSQPPAGRTVSIGISEFTAGDTVEKLLAVADAALYRAKEGGRNRVCHEGTDEKHNHQP
jgi:diguanylate cyclase (GGDEF)-like protein